MSLCYCCGADRSECDCWTEKNPNPSILQDAIAAVTGPRQLEYGHPRTNWGRTAEIASTLLGHEMSPADCVKVAIAMKLARLRQTPNHRDSLVDLAGYAWVLSEVS